MFFLVIVSAVIYLIVLVLIICFHKVAIIMLESVGSQNFNVFFSKQT